MSESSQKWIQRNRKPRTHILMEVETGGSPERKELPFVIGVMGDFAGDGGGENERKPLRDRLFTGINKDNFNDVMENMKPASRFQVKNVLKPDGTEIPVNLVFSSIEDFEPHRVALQVEPLKKLLDARDQLQDLLARLDRDPDQKIEAALQSILREIDKHSGTPENK